MSEQESIQLDEQAEQVETVEPAQPERRVAHWHQADKRASQQGPIQGRELVVGRQKKEPCYEATYHVNNPGGYKINEILYRGRVVVPECVANYLSYMDREWERVERNLFRNNPVNRNYEVGRQ